MNIKTKWTITLILGVILAVFVTLAVLLKEQGHLVNDTKPEGTNQVEDGMFTVKFFSNDGVLLKVESLEENISANPPVLPQIPYGAIFKSWDTDLSAITKDTEVHPVYEDINGISNVFAVTSSYGNCGNTVSVLVQLCGDVCVSGFDMTIRYDSAALELVSVQEDGAVLYNNTAPGEIRLNYVSTNNTLADVDICSLNFTINAQAGQFPVTLELHSIYACEDSIDSEHDNLYVPDSYVVDGTVFVLPKGD